MKRIRFDLTRTPEGFNIRRLSRPSTQVFFVVIVTADLAETVIKLVTKNYPMCTYKIEDGE